MDDVIVPGVRLWYYVKNARSSPFAALFFLAIIVFVIGFTQWYLAGPDVEVSTATTLDWNTCSAPVQKNKVTYMECGPVLLGWASQQFDANARYTGGFRRERKAKHLQSVSYGEIWSEWGSDRTYQKDYKQGQLLGRDARYLVATPNADDNSEPINRAIFTFQLEEGRVEFVDCISRANNFELCESTLSHLFENGINETIAELPNP